MCFPVLTVISLGTLGDHQVTRGHKRSLCTFGIKFSSFYICLYVVWGCVACTHHGICVEIKRQLVGITSFLPPCGLQGLNPGHQVWWQSPLTPELSFLFLILTPTNLVLLVLIFQVDLLLSFSFAFSFFFHFPFHLLLECKKQGPFQNGLRKYKNESSKQTETWEGREDRREQSKEGRTSLRSQSGPKSPRAG